MRDNYLIADRYLVLRKLDEGGMGIVYMGRDTETDETIVIKHLRARFADADLIERFRREGEALRDLNHPNIVKLLDAIEDNDEHYLIMEYVSGGNLRQNLNANEPILEQVLRYAIDLADALTRAHKLDIIHRDLKPENILLAEDGTLRLTDFGIARIGGKQRVTGDNKLIGTVTYLAPEVIQRQEITPRADIWAFGLILLETLTGKFPFEADNILDMMKAIQSAPIPDLEALRPDLPIALIDLIYRMLMRDPNERISSVRYVGAILEDILHNRSSSAPKLERFDNTSSDITIGKHNLPVQTTPFVGRETEINQIITALHDTHTRLLTIVAPGGMGKTRLSLAIAEKLLESGISTSSSDIIFVDGVYFVELAPLSDPDTIINAIADALGYQFTDDKRAPKQQILDYLADKSIVLLLDNFEHLLEAKAIVRDILKHTRRIKLLVTSRVRLALAGETLFHLSGIDFPTWETPEDAMSYAAVKLFLNSAHRVNPTFVLTNDNLPHVARICKLVQGMPLGIVLAASWIGVLSTAEIAEEITGGLDFLEAESANLPERQQSIRAVFEYSWSLMPSAERDIFMKLSLFRGGFSRQAGQTITGATLRQLMALLNRSLITRNPDNGRYNVHELLRQYAERQLSEHGDEPAVVFEHAQYYADALSHQLPLLESPQQLESLKDIEMDMENIRIAWLKSLQIGRYDIMDTMLHGIWLYTITRDQQFLLDDLFMPLYEIVRQQPELSETLRRLWHRTMIRWTGVYESLPYRADFPIDIDEVRAIVEEESDTYERAVGCYSLGWYMTTIQEFDTADHYMLRADKLFKKLDERYLRSVCLARLGFTSIVKGDIDQFRKYSEASVELSKEAGMYIQRFRPLNNLGAVAFFSGDYTRARQRFNETIILIRKSGYFTTLFPFSNLALMDFVLGNFEMSRHMLDTIDQLVKNASSVTGYGLSLAVRAMLLAAEGKYTQSLKLGKQSLDYASNVSVQFSCHLALGMAYIGLSNIEKAEQVLVESLSFLTPVNNYRGVFYLSIPILSAIKHHQGKSRLATAYLSMAFHHLAQTQSFIHKWTYIEELQQSLRNTLSTSDFTHAWCRILEASLNKSARFVAIVV